MSATPASGRAAAADSGQDASLDFRQMAEALPHLVWSTRADGATDYCNGRFLRYFGRSLEEVQGWQWVSIVHPADRQRTTEAWDAACTSGTEFFIEYRLLGVDGQYRWHTGRAAPLYDAGGKILRWFGTCSDIDEHRCMQEQLQASKEKYRGLVETTSDCIWEIDALGRFTYLSPAFQAVTGYQSEEFLGLTPVDLLPPDELATVGSRMQSGLASQQPVAELVHHVRRRDGLIGTVEVSAVPVFDAAGEYRGMRGVTRDISVRVAAEAELRKLHRDLRLALQSANAGVWEWSYQTGRLTWSDELYRIFGLAPEAGCISTERWEQLLLPEDVPRIKALLEAAVGRQDHLEMEYRIVLPSGAVRWVCDLGDTYRDDNGKPLGRAGICFDITARKGAEEALRENQQRLNFYVENSPLATIEWDGDFRVTRWSGEAERIFGWSAAETLGKPIMDLHMIVEEDVPTVERTMAQLAAGTQKYVITANRNYTRDGRVIACEWYNTILKNSRGETVFTLSQVMDVTERKRTEESLRKSEERYRAIVEGQLEFVVRFLPGGIATYVNDAIAQWAGRRAEDLLGKSCYPFIHEADRDEVIRKLEALSPENLFVTILARNVSIDGRLCWHQWVNRAFFDEQGRIVEYQGVGRDITETVLAAEALAAAKAAADAASRAKSEFLARMSHEIRTPITGILGMAELLEGTVLTPPQHKYVQTVLTSTESLLTLVNDLLDLAKIEAGRLELEHNEFSLREVVNEVLASQLPLAQAKGLSTRSSVPAEVPDRLVGDPYRLKQILLNLVGNAVKFTERGEIALAVAVGEGQGGAAELRFDVTDTGIGIAPEAIARIFRPFTQADASTTRRFGGTGLGLAICAQLATLMGGEVWVDSREGAGSTFHVRIPFATAGAGREADTPRPPDRPPAWEGPPLRVLLAEDNEISRMFFAESLEKYGHHVDSAGNGAEALEQLGLAAYDIVLMDVQMPVMDGVEAVNRLRRLERETGGHVPVVALTAHAMEEDRLELLDSGFDGYVSKPLKIRDLFREIKRCLGG